eukprot:scaffold12156_cov114-Isochrysis_galbana.AAC.3
MSLLLPKLRHDALAGWPAGPRRLWTPPPPVCRSAARPPARWAERAFPQERHPHSAPGPEARPDSPDCPCQTHPVAQLEPRQRRHTPPRLPRLQQAASPHPAPPPQSPGQFRRLRLGCPQPAAHLMAEPLASALAHPVPVAHPVPPPRPTPPPPPDSVPPPRPGPLPPPRQWNAPLHPVSPVPAAFARPYPPCPLHPRPTGAFPGLRQEACSHCPATRQRMVRREPSVHARHASGSLARSTRPATIARTALAPAAASPHARAPVHAPAPHAHVLHHALVPLLARAALRVPAPREPPPFVGSSPRA